MKYGCCVNLLPNIGTLAGASYFAPLKELGYDYVEVSLKMLAELSAAELAEVRRMLHGSDLPCRACNDFMPVHYQIVGNELTPRDTIEEYFKRAFDLIGAECMGAKIAVFGSPWSRRCPDGFDRDVAWRQIADFLAETAEIAKGRGVTVVIEAVNSTETNMLNRFSDAVKMVCEVKHPSLMAHCDYYHIVMEDDDPKTVLDGGEFIRHTHAAEKNRAYLTLADADSPRLLTYAEALRKTVGYDGGMSFEARPKSEESWYAEAKEGLALLKKVFG